VGLGVGLGLLMRLAAMKFWRTSLALVAVVALMVAYGRWGPMTAAGGGELGQAQGLVNEVGAEINGRLRRTS